MSATKNISLSATENFYLSTTEKIPLSTTECVLTEKLVFLSWFIKRIFSGELHPHW